MHTKPITSSKFSTEYNQFIWRWKCDLFSHSLLLEFENLLLDSSLNVAKELNWKCPTGSIQAFLTRLGIFQFTSFFMGPSLQTFFCWLMCIHSICQRRMNSLSMYRKVNNEIIQGVLNYCKFAILGLNKIPIPQILGIPRYTGILLVLLIKIIFPRNSR